MEAEYKKVNIEYKVFEALGYVSLCWSEMPKGVFDDKKATKIGEDLIKYIQDSELSFARTIADKLEVHISDEELKSMYDKWLENGKQ